MKRVSLDEIDVSAVRHNPSIAKQVMLARGDAPGLTNFSQAVLSSGQVAGGHAHDDMWEVFFVRRGRGRMTVDGLEHELTPGDCIVVAPHEWHEVCNPYEEDLVLLYFGLRDQPETME